MNPKPIATYCKQNVSGWDDVTKYVAKESGYNNNDCFCSFANPVSGLNFVASVRDLGVLNIIHVTIAPLRVIRPEWTDEQWQDFIVISAKSIIGDFFPGRDFAKQPDDPRKPDAKHYFAVIGVNE
jgi:hypothetical protein